MEYKVITQQGNNYIVSDDNAWLWVEIERELGYTVVKRQKRWAKDHLM
jgi:hypothetical protein